ncbi:hypothetical protein CsSME_00050882 [Camellia sinensis var. sinensis]
MINDYRPISLCNVVYKIIAKVLANRLRRVLSCMISSSQNAFVPGRIITDNILLAHEMFHLIKTRKKEHKSVFAVKLDMNKAYDRVRWDFLLMVIRRFGFSERWVKLIEQCISTVSFSVLVNSNKSEWFFSFPWFAAR